LGIPAGWSIGAAAPLPKPGAWDLESVLLKRDGTTATAQAKVRVKLTALVGAWTVMQPLAPGSPLDPSQLHWDLYDPRSLTAPPLPRAIPDGATAGRSLAAGQVLCAGDVNDASTMHAGQRVTLMIKEDSIEASDEGVLLDSGGQGSLLRAQHLRSGKLVRGRLSGHVLLVEG
jgi:flagella basal body P-ring formation protein FlgA